MQHAEKELQHTVMENPTKETVTHRNRTKAVAMTDAEYASIDLHKGRLYEFLHSKFLEIAVSPHIVVSLEEIHIHAPVYQVSYSSEHSDISLRNDIPILIPEIPDITQKIKRRGFLRKRPEETNEAGLTGSRVIDLQTEMDV
jgi:hypothetical protein